MQKQVSTFLALLAIACLGVDVPSAAAQPSRRSMPTRLAAPRTEPAIAPLAPTQTVHFGLTLSLRNESTLEALVQQQNDPASPRYHQYLTTEEFNAEYAPSQADYDRVLAFAAEQGFAVTHTFANRLLVNVSATPANINKTFGVRMQIHQHAATNIATPAGKTTAEYYAPDVEPSIEASVPILNVVGLSTRDLPHDKLVYANTKHGRALRAHALRSAQPFDVIGSGPDGQYFGSDIRTAYTNGTTLTGAGQTVGLVELGPYNLSDVTAYFKAANQPLNVPVINVLVDTDGVCPTHCNDGEEAIDIQQAISMAPGLSALIVYEGDGLGSFAQAASDNVAKQISFSFGYGGVTTETAPDFEHIFLEMRAQGQNLFVATGDDGAEVGTVDYPTMSPNIVAVGGTTLVTNGAGGTWQSETAWNGSAGGWNSGSPIPAYQIPFINKANGGSPSYRNVADVSAEADSDNFYCSSGGCFEGVGGTSLSAPRWAGFLALANEQANGKPVGFLNNSLYAPSKSGAYPLDLHDITEGNDFNDGSPNLFSATKGYDLVTGWGSPNGANTLNKLAPPPAAGSSQANFTFNAASKVLRFTAATASTTLTLNPIGGFAGTANLTVSIAGSPAGFTTTLGSSKLDAGATTTLDIHTNASVPGGTYLLAVTAISGGLSHIAYIELLLPDFSLTSAVSTLYLGQQGTSTGVVSVSPINGFDGEVTLSSGDLPPGVTGSFSLDPTPTKSTINLNAALLAPTSAGTPVKVRGVAGGSSHLDTLFTVAVSAEKSDCGLGDVVDFTPHYNVTAFYTDGAKFTESKGIDGHGYAFSSTELGSARVLDGIRFLFGKPNMHNALYANGQTITLPQGQFNALHLMGTGLNGIQLGQRLTVTYTDGTEKTFTQSFSDWFQGGLQVNEAVGVATAHATYVDGTVDGQQFTVYGYTLVLDSSKTVKSLTLPVNRNLVLLAGSLSAQDFGTQVNLAKSYNMVGIYKDGSKFGPNDAFAGTAYSANLLQDTAASGVNVVVGYSVFHLAPANVPNTVEAAGQTIPLPPGYYQDIKLLGLGYYDQINQSLQINYTDGTSDTLQQSFSDWGTIGGYSRESVALNTSYLNNYDGTKVQQAFNTYLYTIPLNLSKTVKSITLPSDGNVGFLGITLDAPSIFNQEPTFCNPKYF